MNPEMVSIIIPNYNRASLIVETLSSILLQIYPHWECIIVDDISTDNSIEVIQKFIENDARFKLIQRPIDYPKGANACRNIGLKQALGEYIIYFDSDDLMNENHIERKLEAIQSGNYDFVVARSEYFNNPKNINPMDYRGLGRLPITADNFITKKINWITFDPIIKSKIAKSINFTEENQSAEEYNYFVKLVLLTENTFFLNEILTLRRYHEGSYQVNLNDKAKIAINQFHYYFDTYLEVKKSKISKKSKKYLLNQSVDIFYRNKKELNFYKKKLYKEIMREFGLMKGLNKIRIINMI